MEQVAIIGASRGLGRAFTQHLQALAPENNLLLVSRQLRLLKELSRPQDTIVAHDLANEGTIHRLYECLEQFQPQRIFYFAGGGPFGPFAKKAFKDHQWAWVVSFLRPAQLLHWAAQQKNMKQFVLTGSAVAELEGDPYAASYAASKAALRGLYLSLVKEKFPLDLRLLSPTYMNTDLLPPNAQPRRSEQQILEPEQVAARLWEWVREEGTHYGQLVVK